MLHQRLVLGDEFVRTLEEMPAVHEQSEPVPVGEQRIHLEHDPVVPGLDETTVELQGEFDEPGDIPLGEGGAMLCDETVEFLR